METYPEPFLNALHDVTSIIMVWVCAKRGLPHSPIKGGRGVGLRQLVQEPTAPSTVAPG